MYIWGFVSCLWNLGCPQWAQQEGEAISPAWMWKSCSLSSIVKIRYSVSPRIFKNRCSLAFGITSWILIEVWESGNTSETITTSVGLGYPTHFCVFDLLCTVWKFRPNPRTFAETQKIFWACNVLHNGVSQDFYTNHLFSRLLWTLFDSATYFFYVCVDGSQFSPLTLELTFFCLVKGGIREAACTVDQTSGYKRKDQGKEGKASTLSLISFFLCIDMRVGSERKRG